jgi:hypothetical protein
VARIRTVKPDIWKSEQISDVSIEARLTFLGLITQADDYGRMKGSPKLVRSLVFPYDEYTVQNITEWLRELHENDLIRWYTVKGKQFIELPTWGDHQRVSHPTDSVLPSHSEADSADAPQVLPNPPEEPYREGKGREGSRKGRESAVVPTTDAPLSHLLADLVAANDPNGKRPTVSKAWATEEDRMLRLDERGYLEAERLIRWTQGNSFWRGNVLSMPKFREKYGQLYQAAVDETEKARGGKPQLSPAERRADEIRTKREARAA